MYDLVTFVFELLGTSTVSPVKFFRKAITGKMSPAPRSNLGSVDTLLALSILHVHCGPTVT